MTTLILFPFKRLIQLLPHLPGAHLASLPGQLHSSGGALSQALDVGGEGHEVAHVIGARSGALGMEVLAVAAEVGFHRAIVIY